MSSRPQGARVLLDGREAGRTPLREALVAPGAHRVELFLDGHASQVTTVQLAAGEARALAFLLEPLAEARPAPTPPRGRRLRWTWVAAGGAVAAAGAGLGLGLWARTGWNDYQEAARTGDYWSYDYDELKGSVRGRAAAANVCFGVAGALAVTAAVLFFFVESPAKTPPAARAARSGEGRWQF